MSASNPTLATGEPPVDPSSILPLPQDEFTSPAATNNGQDKKPDPPKLKKFTLSDVTRTIEVAIHWPAVYPGYEPWKFQLRLALSKEIEKKRQEWLGLTDEEANDPATYRANVLEQLCDLMVTDPTGFGDLDQHSPPNIDPGTKFKNYVDAAKDNPDQAETLARIIQQAYNAYWGKALPQTFRQ